jgi:4'-phosphopantetheinyl transferase
MTDVYWLQQSEADVPVNNEWLSDNEKLRLGKMRFPKRRADWLLGRWTAKRTVAALLNVPGNPSALTNIEIRPALSGAPEAFLANRPAELTISLSHRSGTAICAVAALEVELGCDVEVVESHSEAFVADYFTDEEQHLVAQTSPPDRWRTVTLLWSAKESALQALHAGLRLDTRSVIVLPEDSARSREEDRGNCADFASYATPRDNDGHYWRRLRVHHISGQVFEGWWRHTDSFVLTLVAEPPPAPPISLISLHHHPAQCPQSQKSKGAFDTVEGERGSAIRE